MSDAKEKHLSEKPVSFKAADGYPLSGTLVEPDDPEITVLISSGTGFPQGYYLACARHFASKGVRVLVFDYRGIGASAPDDLSKMQMDYTDFGRLDLAAAADFLANQPGNLEMVHLAHSVGGHMVGFMPNHHRIKRHAFVAVGSGYWRKHKLSYIPFALTFWWLLGPYNLAGYGYIKKSALWRGEALPMGVFKTWRRWCAQPTYYAEELQNELKPHSFSKVKSPIKSWVYADDPIASKETTQDILDCYPNASSSIIERHPKDYNLKQIAHAGMFRKGMNVLWDEWWDWLKQH